METLKIEEMHCINCANRISSALKTEGIKFEIDLEEKSVKIDSEKTELAIEILEDIGFTATIKNSNNH